MKTKFITMLLILALLILGMQIYAAANESYFGKCGDNVTYSFDPATGALQINGTGSMTNWDSKVDYKTPWEEYINDIRSVIISDGVKNIGERSFSNCVNLTEVNIPDSIECIGMQSFEYCIGIKEIVFPASVEVIGNSAFAYCSGLKSVTLPDNIKAIDYGAFQGCSALESVYVTKMDNIEINEPTYDIVNPINIYNDAFADCSSLRTVTIPGRITAIGLRAFDRCKKLENVVLHSNVKDISDYAFRDCISLKSLVLPDSINTIGGGAFEGCRLLKTVNLTLGLQYLENSIFEGCESLESMVIPQGITQIGVDGNVGCVIYVSMVFAGCTSLKTVTIPKSVESIGSYSFGGCLSLTDVYYEGSEADWQRIAVSSGNEYLQNANIHFNYTYPAGTTYQDEIEVYVDGVKIEFDQPPVIENGRTLIPIRAVSEAVGADVEWDENTQTVYISRNNHVISMQVGRNTMIKNLEAFDLDVTPKIINSRTMVPVRAIAEGYGFDVEWDEVNCRVLIWR